ncbi:MAG: CAP domain-containing protein [Candidatus Kerfeldbacteria bacterium]|nr:CAP domain-containing protein [Candidatus Kerfeldbacteria bacterium]
MENEYLRRWRGRSSPAGQSKNHDRGEVCIAVVDGQPGLVIKRTAVLSFHETIGYRPPFRSWWLIGMFIIGAWLSPRAAEAELFSAGAIIARTNDVRREHRLPPLAIDQRLMAAAAAKVHDLVDDQYFAHTAPDGQSPWVWMEAAGYQFTEASENLAIAFKDPTAVIDAWLDSRAHRRNLLSRTLSDVGAAVAEASWNGTSTIMVVEFFGRRKAAPTPTMTTNLPKQPMITVPPEFGQAGNEDIPTRMSLAEPAPLKVIPSLVTAGGRPLPNLRFTIQAPGSSFSDQALSPQVKGAFQSLHTGRAIHDRELAGNPELTRLIILAMAINLTAVAGYGLYRIGPRGSGPSPAAVRTPRP